MIKYKEHAWNFCFPSLWHDNFFPKFPFHFPIKNKKKKMKVDYIPKKQYIKISPKNNILTAQVELS